MSTAVNSNFQQVKKVAIALLLTHPFVMGSAVFAQSIVPANDLGTQINSAASNPQQINITGGTQAGANLYHSFQQFGLDQGQIANFLSNPSIQNILSRVVGGSPSVINGLIQVTGGNSNLYLLNPAGIIFGSNASLNVPAAFTATTANGIQVGNGWFGVHTSVDAIKNLSGNPQAFGFAANASSSITTQGAPVINAGNLVAKEGQSITLVGGLVINTGTIASPAGKVTIAAVADGKYVKITPEGSLLSLELPVAAQQELVQRSILGSDLPNLLTGSSELRNVTGLNVNNSGNVLVANSPIPSTAGTAITSGIIDVSSNTAKGGEINVLGDRVGLISANLNASGAIGGGTVLIGGDLQGKGTVPNSQFTYVSPDSTIIADALYSGNGGKVIVWSDQVTRFYGTITAKGGIIAGDGGFVEISGKNGLDFQGNANPQATNGKSGILLLDPYDLIIDTFGTTNLAQAANLSFGADFTTSNLDVNLINTAAIGTTIFLQARNNITFNSSVNNPNDNVNLNVNAGNSITIANNVNVNVKGIFSLVATGDISILTKFFSINGGLSITSYNGKVSSQNISGQTSDVSIISYGDISTGFISAGNVLLRSFSGNISTDSITADTFTPAGTKVSLIADNGNITLQGFIKSSNASNINGDGITHGDGRIEIRGNSFRAINPVDVGDLGDNNTVPASLVIFNYGQQDDGQGTPYTPRRLELTLPNDPQPRILSGKLTDPLSISITILKDTSFRFSKITPTPVSCCGGPTIIDRLPSTGSGIEGAISLGFQQIPPEVLVLISDQSFSSNLNLGGDVLAANLNGNLDANAVASTRTANLQANTSEVKECEPKGSKKPILTITASLPSASTRTAQNIKPSGLPPCNQ